MKTFGGTWIRISIRNVAREVFKPGIKFTMFQQRRGSECDTFTGQKKGGKEVPERSEGRHSAKERVRGGAGLLCTVSKRGKKEIAEGSKRGAKDLPWTTDAYEWIWRSGKRGNFSILHTQNEQLGRSWEGQKDQTRIRLGKKNTNYFFWTKESHAGKPGRRDKIKKWVQGAQKSIRNSSQKYGLVVGSRG